MEMDTTIQNQNPVETPQNEPPQGNIVNQKGFFPIVIGVIVLLLVFAGGAYYLGTQNNRSQLQSGTNTDNKTERTPQPTNNPTPIPSINNGLKTYQGQLYNFQYPQDWVLLKSDKNSVTFQKEELMAAQGAYPAQTVKVTLSIYSNDIESTTTLDNWLETRYLRSNDKNLYDLIKQFSKKTTLGGTDAISVQVPGAGGYIDNGTVAIYKDKGYDISIIGSEIKGSLEAYQTIISTFKFTN